MTQSEIEESNLHLREVWKLYAHRSPGGEVFDQDGLSVANARQPWFFMNIGMLNQPVANEPDLERRAKEALELFIGERNPWVLAGSEDWFGSNADAVLSEVGLEHKLNLTGMVTERLRDPIHALPDVQLRRIADEETRFAIADLNADAYGVPREWGRKALSSASLWQMPLFGTIAYVNGEPASAAFTLLVDKALYVAWVATSRAHRRLGLAELVIRRSLEDARNETGVERTVLHATAEGFPVYQRMGYRPVVKFPFYGPRS